MNTWCRRLTAVVALAVGAAHADVPVRLVLAVGSDVGDGDETPLHHAEDDAQRVRDVLVELGGAEPTRAVVLKQPSALEVTSRLAEMCGRVAELKSAGRRVELFVFASAHGKNGRLHLSGTHLALKDLRAQAVRCGADVSVTVVDACEAGGVAREKGARRGFAYELDVPAPAVKGEVFISSAAAHEAAQEWDALDGSLFTHHLLTAWRGDGDADGDGRVSLMESFAYAQRRTVANSVARGQHPEFEVNLAGTHDVFVTELHLAKATVVFGENLEGRFVLVSQPKPDIVTEFTKDKGRVLTLAVPPGRYLLRQSQGALVGLQDIELPYGGSARVKAEAFVTRHPSEVALKGGVVELRPHALQVSGALASPPIAGTPARWAVGLGYRFGQGRAWGAVAAEWGTSSFRAVALTTTDQLVRLQVSGGYRFWVGPVVLMPGLALEGAALVQHSVRDRETEIRLAYPALPERVTLGLGVGPQLRSEWAVAGPVFAVVGATGWLRALQTTDAPLWTFGAQVDIGVGVRL